MNHARMLTAIGLLSLLLPANLVASPRVVPLHSSTIASEVPNWYELGVLPGDFLLESDSARAIVLTAQGPKGQERAGGCMILVAGKDPVLYAAGPSIGWKGARPLRHGNTVGVRFDPAQPYQGELSYTVSTDAEGVVASTRIVNTSSHRLELPIVDLLAGSDETHMERQDGKLVLLDKEKGHAVMTVDHGQRESSVGKVGDGNWRLGIVSGEPLAGVFRRMGRRIWPGSTKTWQPVSAQRNWPRTMRDRESWFRLDPKDQRLVERRLIVAPEYRASQELAIAPVATDNREDDQPRHRIVGKLRAPASMTTSTEPEIMAEVEAVEEIEESRFVPESAMESVEIAPSDVETLGLPLLIPSADELQSVPTEETKEDTNSGPLLIFSEP
ncbi:hypothetical protein Pan216_52970 [Planctomycetes bacterium Pan216]|uniref:Secreted protein n=1 Tax=Kolteria novifilia TaxID=2527975 RepID=A0A518BBT2_9BACT|nr:hypothetical protein Pan216_52970 [Planctomycetes bacterium Pan216]